EMGGGGRNSTAGGLTTTPGTGAGNVISGNGNPFGTDYGSGVLIYDQNFAGTSDNVIEGNIIGLDRTGTKATDTNGASLGNTDGVLIVSANHITIGGSVTGARNVISNNAVSGVRVGESSDDVIAGNYIGTDVTGEIAMGNAYGHGSVSGGIWLQSLNSNILIGGTTPDGRNVISGNTTGISVTWASNSQIEGNYIGTDATGNAPLGNHYVGIALTGESDGGANNILVGGLTSTPGTGAGNVISGNSGGGVLVGGKSSGKVLEGNVNGLAANGTALGDGG